MILKETTNYNLEMNEDELTTFFSVFDKLSQHTKKIGFIKKIIFNEDELQFIKMINDGRRGIQKDTQDKTE